MTKQLIGLAQAVLSTMLLITGFKNDTIDCKTGKIIHKIQPESTILGIKFVLSVFPFLMMLLGLCALYFYPSARETLDMKQKLRELHSKKEQTIKKNKF